MRRSEAERKELAKIFDAYVEDAFEKAFNIREERGKGYNNSVIIPDYFPHGEQDIVYEVTKKLMRFENTMLAENCGLEVDASAEDSIIDSINYLAFLYAYRKMKKEELI